MEKMESLSSSTCQYPFISNIAHRFCLVLWIKILLVCLLLVHSDRESDELDDSGDDHDAEQEMLLSEEEMDIDIAPEPEEGAVGNPHDHNAEVN